MFPIRLCALAMAAAVAAPLLASAQSAAPRPDPLDAKAATTPLTHRSALTSYRRLGAETPPLPWREANAAVERIGGWRSYAREANAPGPAASAPAPGHRH